VVMGAVLTQNTAWANASAALQRLTENDVRRPSDLLGLGHSRVARLVRSAGYFNQKARKLLSIAAFFASAGALSASRTPDRRALLAEWGIGPETADSILLYAFHAPVFVVDAYTRRILSRIGLLRGTESYDEIQQLFHSSLAASAPLFNEYHALLVEHAKAHCRTRPECGGCPVNRCRHRRTHRP
jgi:endonuclease-3 related protein